MNTSFSIVSHVIVSRYDQDSPQAHTTVVDDMTNSKMAVEHEVVITSHKIGRNHQILVQRRSRRRKYKSGSSSLGQTYSGVQRFQALSANQGQATQTVVTMQKIRR
jgi:hypothetical protein